MNLFANIWASFTDLVTSERATVITIYFTGSIIILITNVAVVAEFDFFLFVIIISFGVILNNYIIDSIFDLQSCYY